ncbi:MAG: type VI secretion system-associated protein TagF [Gammaproteobacteria bacterium]
MTEGAAAVGFFGKLPCRGDFLQRRVRPEFVDVWDDWLQRCIGESSRQMQDRWLDAYLTGPVWRFVLSPGICGTGAYAGVLVPSVDRVGRYFPLAIVAQWNADDSPLAAACGASAWFDAAEALALQAPETSDFDAFDANVARLGGLIDSSGVAESSHLHELLSETEFPHRLAQWHVPLESVQSLQRAVNELAVRELERTLRPLSLWWSDGSNDVEPAWLCARGLPAPNSFAAMLSGEWSSSGWTSVGEGLDRHAARPSKTNVPASEPGVRVTACHEPVTREWGAATSGAEFISRPEMGLWAVAMSGVADKGRAAAQAIGDALQGVPSAATLTALAEAVRHTLNAVRGQIARGSLVGASGADLSTAVIVFLVRGTECALVYAGAVQAFRVRGSSVAAVISVAAPEEVTASANTLLDLVSEGERPAALPAGESEARVRYSQLHAHDTWVIAGKALFEDLSVAERAAAAAHGAVDGKAGLALVRSACEQGGTALSGPLPVLLLAATQTPSQG